MKGRPWVPYVQSAGPRFSLEFSVIFFYLETKLISLQMAFCLYSKPYVMLHLQREISDFSNLFSHLNLSVVFSLFICTYPLLEPQGRLVKGNNKTVKSGITSRSLAPSIFSMRNGLRLKQPSIIAIR